jgi:glycosyltransferase involved in cell wall biosynthesis
MLPVAKSAAEACGAKLVYDSHELYVEQEFSPRERKCWQAIEAKYIGACDAVITVNHSIASELAQRYGLGKVNVILNAAPAGDVPAEGRLFHEAFGLAPEKKVLLLQGGLSAGRNLEGLVAAMRHVRNETVVLVVLGDGVLSSRLEAIAKAEGITNRVFFHPAVAQSQLSRWTASAAAGVIPYQATCLNNRYCTPNKLFEFIAAGLPILASDLPELRKMVEGRQIGLVGETGSPRKLAALVDEFFSDEQRCRAWQSNVLELRRHVCWEVEQDKLVEIYEALR